VNHYTESNPVTQVQNEGEIEEEGEEEEEGNNELTSSPNRM
jgi:hypothetical protein